MTMRIIMIQSASLRMEEFHVWFTAVAIQTSTKLGRTLVTLRILIMIMMIMMKMMMTKMMMTKMMRLTMTTARMTRMMIHL